MSREFTQVYPKFRNSRWSSDPRDSLFARTNHAWIEHLIASQNMQVEDYRPVFELTFVTKPSIQAEEIIVFDKGFSRAVAYRNRNQDSPVRVLLCKEICPKSYRLHWHGTVITRLSRRQTDDFISECHSIASKQLQIDFVHFEAIRNCNAWLRYVFKVRKPRESLLDYGKRVLLFKRNLRFQLMTQTGGFYRDTKANLYRQAISPSLN